MENKLKNIFKGKRKNENLIILCVLLVIVVVAVNYLWKEPDKNIVQEQSNEVIQVSNIPEDSLETKLENILTKINGVGKVKVLITYSESNKVQPIFNENYKVSNTTENDDSGGKRTIEETDKQKEVVFKENNDGTKEPVTQSIISPKIEGAVIAAQGANNAEIKARIIQAVEAATGIANHKIQVFEMEGN